MKKHVSLPKDVIQIMGNLINPVVIQQLKDEGCNVDVVYCDSTHKYINGVFAFHPYSGKYCYLETK